MENVKHDEITMGLNLDKMELQFKFFGKYYTKEELKVIVGRTIAKKPINKTMENEGEHAGFWHPFDGYYHTIDRIICPHCKKRLKVNKAKHCDKCGGALDWSEDDEI